MNRSETIIELIKSLNKCQSEIKGAPKETKNSIYNSKYADLQSVWEAIREPMTKHGLAITQTTSIGTDGKSIALITTLFHISGEWIESHYPVLPMQQKKDIGWVDTNNPQAMGSCLTYARRYTLMAMIGIAPEDDDGNAASGHTVAEAKPQSKQPGPTTDAKKEEKSPENGKSEEKNGDSKTFEHKKDDNAKFIEVMKKMEAELGKKEDFYQILGQYGFSSADQVVDRDKQKSIYLHLKEWIEEKKKVAK